MLRTLVEIYGGPTIIVLYHPVKNANPDSLVIVGNAIRLASEVESGDALG
jgi:hypothetical protein